MSLFKAAARVRAELGIDFCTPTNEECLELVLITAFERFEKSVAKTTPRQATRGDFTHTRDALETIP